MDVPGASGASRRDRGKGRGFLWLFVSAVLLQPVAGEMEVCQCDFGNSSWEENLDNMIRHLDEHGRRSDFWDEGAASTQFIRNYECPKDLRETDRNDWKCRPEQSAVAAVCGLQAVDATTRRLVEPGALGQRRTLIELSMSYREALRYMSFRWRKVVVSEHDQQRKVCEEQRSSAGKVEAQRRFEARRAEAQAKEAAKEAEANEAPWRARAEAAEEALKRAEQLCRESQAKVKKAEAEAKRKREFNQPAVPGSWRFVLASVFLLLCFCALVPRRFGKLLASFLCPARDRTVDTGDGLKRSSEELEKAVCQMREVMVEEFDASKNQLCPKQQEAKVPSAAGEQIVMQLADQLADNGKALLQLKGVMEEHLDAMKFQLRRKKQEAKPSAVEDTTHPTEEIAMPQADDASEVWSHTSWVEVNSCEALAANSLPKISAGGTDSPEPCCFLQESLFLAEDKRTYIQGFDLHLGCKISAADGSVIRVRKVPELHRVDKTLNLRAGSAVLPCTPDHRITLPTGDTVPADTLRIGQEVMVQNTPTQLTSIELSYVPVNVLKLAFDPDLPVEVLVPPPAIQSKGTAKKALRRSLVGRRGSPEEPSIPDTEAEYQD
ncbi:unnamed protein product [Symbiodinium sp. CCMP2456]|nr:unnamed protein product [Symbiodinium sp. CCMP2456]